MSLTPCRSLEGSRSALVDGALTTEQRERVLTHLVHCDACRDDVAALRRVRDTLRAPAPASAPRDLDARLISIAGDEAPLPLWTRPFRRTRPGALTSPRRTLRLRVTAAAVAVGTTVGGAGLVGYAAAPVVAMTEVADPTDEARAAFSATLAQQPLVNDAVGAVLAAAPADLDETVPTAGGTQARAGTRPLSAAAAAEAMERASDVADTVAYSGLQTFRSQAQGLTYSASVVVQSVPGQGSQAHVLDRSGAEVSTGYTPAVLPARMVDDSLVALLETNYAVTGWAGAQAAGRPATMVEARRAGVLAARWWLDDASGIVLAQQTFDADGDQVMAVGFSTVKVSGPAGVLEQLPASVAVPVTDTVLTLSAASALVSRGWVCRDQVAGLSLVRLRSDRSDDPDTVHLVYSDGLSTLSVFEQRGRLADAPEGSRWDAALGAWTRPGASSLASWQSGSTVFTVVTNGSTEVLAAAVASLPHDAPPERTTMERIREGWAVLLADMKG